MNNPAMTITLAVILTVMFLAYSTFAYRYFRHSPWNATWQGVTLLAQKVTMAAFVGFFIVDTLVPNSYPGRYSILVILLTLLAIEAIATLVGLLHVQRSRAPVSRRQGTGYANPEDIRNTDPSRVQIIHPDKE